MEDISVVQSILAFFTVAIEFAVSYGLVGTASVVFFRSTWVLLDAAFKFPKSSSDISRGALLGDGALSLAVGSIVLILLTIVHYRLIGIARSHAVDEVSWKYVFVAVVDRIWTYISACACVCVWRGTWHVIDAVFQPTTATGGLITAGIALAVATLTWTSRSLVLPPVMVSVDDAAGAFAAPRWSALSRVLLMLRLASSSGTSISFIDPVPLVRTPPARRHYPETVTTGTPRSSAGSPRGSSQAASPHGASPRAASPPPHSPHAMSPHLRSPHAASPQFASPHSPQVCSPRSNRRAALQRLPVAATSRPPGSGKDAVIIQL